METKLKSLKVEPIPDSPMWYKVQSESSPNYPNEVHLDALGGNGECHCVDFTIKCYPNFKKNGGKWIEYGEAGSPNPARTMCRHVKVSRKYLLDSVLRYAAKQLKERK